MSAASFPACLAFVLTHEGGYTDDPRDPGGATNLGITLRVLAAWRHADVTKADVQALQRAEAAAIYRAQYWNAAHGDVLPAGVDLMTFDAAVNMGVGRAAKMLQAACGATTDGAIGPATLRAVAVTPPDVVIRSMSDQRLTFYRGLPTFEAFGRGWTTRVADCRKAALEMVGAKT